MQTGSDGDGRNCVAMVRGNDLAPLTVHRRDVAREHAHADTAPDRPDERVLELERTQAEVLDHSHGRRPCGRLIGYPERRSVPECGAGA